MLLIQLMQLLVFVFYYFYLEQMLYDAPDEQMLTASKIKGLLTCAGIDEKCVFESFLDAGIHNEIYWERALKGFLDFITK